MQRLISWSSTEISVVNSTWQVNFSEAQYWSYIAVVASKSGLWAKGHAGILMIYPRKKPLGHADDVVGDTLLNAY